MFLQPGQPAIESTGTETVRALGDYWMITEGQATIMGTPLQSLMTLGFDAAKGTYLDLVAAGIVDPTKVVRIALENAVSVAGTLLLTEATMTEKPEKRDERLPAEAPM